MIKFLLSVKNEVSKQKGGFAVLIAVLSPLTMVLLNFVDLYLRYDYLKKHMASRSGITNPWEIALSEGHFLWVFMLTLSVVILSTLVIYVEQQNGGWRYYMTLPLRRREVYLAKWGTVVILTFIMIFLYAVFMFISGKLLGFSGSPEKGLIVRYVMNECIGALGIISLQVYLSSWSKNITIALSIGFIGVVSQYFFAQSEVLSKIIPYTYELFTLPIKEMGLNTDIPFYGGLAFGSILLILGLLSFKRKDII